MEENKNIRNQPAEKGPGNDPNLRDQTASQPGAQTISSSETDESNEQLTRTASENFRETTKDEHADAVFDDE
ncbi:MAG TPA: hypothetical protein VFZ78_03150 [Flavisolibacter sp.]